MNRIILSTLLFIVSVTITAQTMEMDSMINNIRKRAYIVNYNKIDYKADVLLNGDIHVKKRNFLLDLIPRPSFPIRDTGRLHVELLSNLTFTNPDLYFQKVIRQNFKSEVISQIISQTVFPFISVSLYSPMLFKNIYSPIAPKGDKYYEYSLASEWKENNICYYKILFTPRIFNNKFIDGYMIIDSSNWSICRMSFKGRIEQMSYSMTIISGEKGSSSEYYPKEVYFNADYHLLGNEINGVFITKINYIHFKESTITQRIKGKNKHDLSLLFESTIDTSGVTILESNDTIRSTSKLLKIGDYLTKDYKYGSERFGRIEFTPLICPMMLNYSSTHGLSYSLQLSYKKEFTNGMLFSITPKGGYNFKDKAFHWFVNTFYKFDPQRDGRITFDFSNGDRIYTKEIEHELHNLESGIFDESLLNLDTYMGTYFKLGASMEILNGFNINAIVGVNIYSPWPKSKIIILKPESPDLDKALNIIKDNYSSFVPELRLQWTPGQYYYWDNNVKKNLYSKYPTFFISWAYAIKGALNSNYTYQRIEFDLQHKVKTGLLTTLSYRVGIGSFYNYKDLYFADFWNFRKNDLPIGWDDEIGGTFQLLSDYNYNSINKYVRGNMELDTPLLLGSSVFKNFNIIMKERLYLNMLLVPNMKPYFELGYGIGTYFFDVGLFWGGEINHPDRIGVKLTFNLH
jgi:hypothetical protein